MKKQYITPSILMVNADTQEILESSGIGLSDKEYNGSASLSKKHERTNLWDDSWDTADNDENE